MAPVYKLKYFNHMGLVEPVRYLLAYGNIQYENTVVTETEWTKMQKIVPFSKLPIFEVDGKPLYHSVAICKYIAKQIGLVSFDDFELAELDAIVEVTYDLGYQVWNYHHQVHQELKNVIVKDLVDVTIPKWFADFEDILKKKGGFFGGKKLSWADLYVVATLEFVEQVMNKSWLPKYPYVQQLWTEVQKLPAIKNYISKRPTYKF